MGATTPSRSAKISSALLTPRVNSEIRSKRPKAKQKKPRAITTQRIQKTKNSPRRKSRTIPSKNPTRLRASRESRAQESPSPARAASPPSPNLAKANPARENLAKVSRVLAVRSRKSRSRHLPSEQPSVSSKQNNACNKR